MNLALNDDPGGKVFGNLTILSRCEKGKNRGGYRYRCGCSCGRVLFVKGSKLKKGEAKDCGRTERHQMAGAFKTGASNVR